MINSTLFGNTILLKLPPCWAAAEAGVADDVIIPPTIIIPTIACTLELVDFMRVPCFAVADIRTALTAVLVMIILDTIDR